MSKPNWHVFHDINANSPSEALRIHDAIRSYISMVAPSAGLAAVRYLRGWLKDSFAENPAEATPVRIWVYCTSRKAITSFDLVYHIDTTYRIEEVSPRKEKL